MDWLEQLRRLLSTRQADPATPEIPPLQSHGGWPGRAAIEAFNATQGMGEAAKNMATTDKRYTQEELEKLATGSSMALLGTSRVLPTNPGGASVGMFMGRNAAHAPTPDIQAAQGAAGRADITDIWRGHGVDVTDPGRPRWEISDQGAQLNDRLLRELQSKYHRTGAQPFAQVQDVVSHPELFANYPALGRAPFELIGSRAPAPHGQFLPRAYDWKNPATPPGIVKVNTSLINPGNTDPALSTALHELQHGVQWIEGFPMGANTKIVGEQAREAALKRLTDLYSKDPNSQEAKRLQAMWSRYASDPQTQAGVNFRLYQGAPGEVEARNTQYRQLWTPDERAVTAPWQSADVPAIPGAGMDPKVPWWMNQYAVNRPGAASASLPGPSMAIEPRLRPAVRAGEKVYKSREGESHLDAFIDVPQPLRALAREDLKNHGFVDHRGRFLNREQAQAYALENDLLDPSAPTHARTSRQLISEYLRGRK